MEKNKVIAKIAYQALIEEVNLSPKPGLVDSLNNGSHQDMTLQTFYDSANAISPFFYEYLKIGSEHAGTPIELFEKVRNTGAIAERAMLKATNNINTHKGANFSFAVILSSISQFQKNKKTTKLTEKDLDEILLYTGEMCQFLTKRDFSNLDEKIALTNGEKLFLKNGIKGIRGEAESGYASLREVVLPSLRKYQFLEPEERYLRVFVELMSSVEDSNIYHRGGTEGVSFVKKEASAIKKNKYSKKVLVSQLKILDEKMIQRNLSPGGSADLLSLGIFLNALL